MKRYMKIICMMLAVVLISAFIGGCNSNGLEKLNLDEGKKTKKLSPDSITICFPGPEPGNLNNINEMLVELNKKTMQDFFTEIKLKWLPGTFINYDAGLLETLESGERPDAFWTSQVEIGQLLDKGLIKDITELFPKYAPQYFSLLSKSWGNEAKDCGVVFDKKLYAVLNNDLYPPQSCVVVSKDLAEKYAQGGISTLDDYSRFMKAVKDNEKDMIPGYVELKDFLNAYLEGNGYFNEPSLGRGIYFSWNAKDLIPTLAEEIGEFKTACSLYKQWYENKFLLDRSRDFRKIASIFPNPKYQRTMFSSAGFNSEYSFYPLYLGRPYIRITRSDYAIGINQHSSKTDRVLMFIEWLQESQENYDLFMYGIKDKNYKIKGNKLDFTGLNPALDVIAQWTGSEALINYIYERPSMYKPENYREFVDKCFYSNTMPMNKVYEKFGYDGDKYNSQKVEFYIDNKQAEQYRYNRSCIYDEFIKQWGTGNFTKTLDDYMNERDGKGSTDRLLEAFKAQMKTLKK